jgi:uncharacterized protein (TIGR00730 family)
MASITSVCVYCGSSSRGAQGHRDAAARLGALFAESGIQLVYGGGRVGLMGIMADAALARGGRVIGVIPQHLQDYEIGHAGVTELLVVESMHVRKQRMFELADAFAILPGGLGTLEEAFEMITWKQLGMHDKPIVIVDVEGYWEPLRKLIDAVIDGRYAAPETKRLFTVVETVDEVLEAFAALPQPVLQPETKWL